MLPPKLGFWSPSSGVQENLSLASSPRSPVPLPLQAACLLTTGLLEKAKVPEILIRPALWSPIYQQGWDGVPQATQFPHLHIGGNADTCLLERHEGGWREGIRQHPRRVEHLSMARSLLEALPLARVKTWVLSCHGFPLEGLGKEDLEGGMFQDAALHQAMYPGRRSLHRSWPAGCLGLGAGLSGWEVRG